MILPVDVSLRKMSLPPDGFLTNLEEIIFFFKESGIHFFFFNMEEVVCSHLGPLPIVLSASAFLCNTNFVVVFQAVCREWRQWCRHVEEHHTKEIFTPAQLVSKHYVRSMKIRTIFPCGTYERIQNLTVSASRPSRYLYLDREFRLCSTCRHWFLRSDMYREEQCIHCAAYELCTSCFRNRRHPSGVRCLSCVMRGSFFPGARFRLPLAFRL